MSNFGLIRVLKLQMKGSTCQENIVSISHFLYIIDMVYLPLSCGGGGGA